MSDSAPRIDRRLECLLIQDPTSFAQVSTLDVLSEEAPSLDDELADDLGAELRLLMRALGASEEPSPPPPPGLVSSPQRLGQRVFGEGKEARAWPAFAHALATRAADLSPEGFPDLWMVDARLWSLLVDHASPAELARAWLCSAGRRLMRDLRALSAAAGDPVEGWEPGAAELGWTAICRAAGSKALSSAPAWATLHEALPGRAMLGWRPEPDTVPRALRLLDEGRPVLMRGAALGWLLSRAVDDDIYEVDRARASLRQELPLALAAAIQPGAEVEAERRAIASVEALCMHHVARIAAHAGQLGAVAEVWRVSRWLFQLITRSPFHGGDPLTLAARLAALLPEEGASLDASLHPLHPARFRSPLQLRAGTRAPQTAEGLDLEDVGLLSGALTHYLRQGTKLTPPPLALVRALEHLACRPLRQGEVAAEEAIARALDPLGWPAPHVAPPHTARWLLSRLGVGWLKTLEDEAFAQLIGHMEEAPGRFAWLAYALIREGASLPRERAARVLELARSGGLAGRERAALIAGLPQVVEKQDAYDALERVEHLRSLELEYAPYLLGALLELGEKLPPEASWSGSFLRDVEVALLNLIEHPKLPTTTRERAARAGLRRAAVLYRQRQGGAFSEQLARALCEPPFDRIPAFQRELRALGLGARSGAP